MKKTSFAFAVLVGFAAFYLLTATGCKRWKMTEGGAEAGTDGPKYSVTLDEKSINNPQAK